MNVTIENSTDFKKIYIKSDSSSANTDYPVMEIYVNNSKLYTLVVGGSATVNSIAYTTTSGASNLDFASTTTSKGTEYIHTINPTTLGLTSDRLQDGVWYFKIIGTNSTFINIGTLIHYDIDCCIANNLDSVCDKNCNFDEVIKHSNEVLGLLYSSEISAKLGEFSNSLCKYNIAKNLCKSCTAN